MKALMAVFWKELADDFTSRRFLILFPLVFLAAATAAYVAAQGLKPVYGSEEEVEVLSGWRYKQRRMLSVKEFFLALARLGGHQNRRKDLQPGWVVLWRGWQALQLMVQGARAARLPATPASPPDGS